MCSFNVYIRFTRSCRYVMATPTSSGIVLLRYDCTKVSSTNGLRKCGTAWKNLPLVARRNVSAGRLPSSRAVEASRREHPISWFRDTGIRCLVFNIVKLDVWRVRELTCEKLKSSNYTPKLHCRLELDPRSHCGLPKFDLMQRCIESNS